MSTIGAGSVPITAQSPVQQAPWTPTPVPGPVPVPDPAPPWSPIPDPAPPGLPPDGPDARPPAPPTLPPTGPDQGWPPSKPPIPPKPPLPPTDPGQGWPPSKPPTPPTTPGTPPVDPPPVDPPPVDPPPVDPPPTDPVDDGPNLLPWIIGGGAVLAAGVGTALAIRSGARNVRALDATARAFESGTMHQGGLHAIRDAGLGARFAGGIGASEKALVAIPGVNRVGTGGRLTAVARGHLDHVELLASTAALRRGVGDGVAVHEPLRRHVLDALETGRPMRAILDDLDRSADGARPVFSNPRLVNYWDQASIVERGPRSGGQHVTSAVSIDVPKLRIDGGQIVETGQVARIDSIIAGRGARLGDRGLAHGIGSIQAANVDTLPPALRERAIAASKVDPQLVESIGLRGAYMQRWTDRLAQGAAAATS